MQTTRLNKFQIILLALGLLTTFLLIYAPSFFNPFPKHGDEWHHINQALNLERGEYQWQVLSAFGMGFHFFLYGIHQIADLVQIYRFLAPAWAVISALTLFFIAYSLSKQSFLAAFSAMIFFGSIKSNINLLGLYFFTPLTFGIPFIFLFIFFFVRGLEKENKKYLLLSFLIMLFLVFTHAISATFAFPILFFSAALYYKYIKKEFRFFIIFLLIPLAGFLLYSFVRDLTLINSLEILIKEIQFKRELSLAEALDDSLTTTYSVAGGILAGIGLLVILWNKKKKLYPYIFWPLCLLLMILIFRMADVSYLSPYHRNFYYFTISLPLLSAFGLNWMINFIASRFKRINFNLIAVPILTIAIFLSLMSHYKIIHEELPRLKIITTDDYQDLTFLAGFPRGKIVTSPVLSLAAPTITGHEFIGEFSDKFGFKHAQQFFDSNDCRLRNAMIEVYNIDYVISEHEIFCGYELLRREHNYIYEVRSISRK